MPNVSYSSTVEILFESCKQLDAVRYHKKAVNVLNELASSRLHHKVSDIEEFLPLDSSQPCVPTTTLVTNEFTRNEMAENSLQEHMDLWADLEAKEVMVDSDIEYDDLDRVPDQDYLWMRNRRASGICDALAYKEDSYAFKSLVKEKTTVYRR
ncbi:hypothetical protein M422DRAFT_272749 [Sphaerobolus stellatus SS14]|uniref:Uncharacterized protein n=1 Tax=Sphaerobolus stellatus (strain SS14) TaxID=990650 RepID=A0A0C9UAV9_SPHS4|nr:hypothetical protein M422DRAFT_272749 [Sphaerobolus stellatus SS14]